MAEDLNIQPIIDKAARIMQNELRRQAPVDTGALKKSIRVRGIYNGSSVRFNTEYLYYGKFVDQGTGPYATKARKAWNPAPGKGKGGIKPRFWTTLEGTFRQRINKMITKVIADFIKFSLIRSK